MKITIKSITGGILASFLLVASIVPVQATSVKKLTPVKVSPIPYPICKTVKVTPGNPLTLRGRGSLRAKGKGEVHFRVRRGRVNLKGKGVVAVRVSDNDNVDVSGMGGKIEIGDWIIYWGKGRLTVSGDNYEVVASGRFKVHARGVGRVTFKGHWKVYYCRLLRAKPMPIPKVIPEHLKLDVSE